MRTAIILVLSLAACRDEVPLVSGLDEPIRVEGGFFLAGELPIAEDGPALTSIESTNGIALTGQDDRSLGGRVEEPTWAIGVRFASLGTGWWVHEVGDISPLFAPDRDFALVYDVGAGIPPGLHALHIAAIDGDGARGPEFDLELCVLEDAIPGGLNPCDPTIPPPAMVIGVTWNRDVDLDLIVESPDRKRISWKQPTSAIPDGGVVPDDALEDPTLGRLNRDSNAACRADGRNAEAVTWQELPASGDWSAYVDLFDACGEDDVTFSLAVYRRRERDDGTFFLEEIARKSGTLVADFDAFGGAKPALFVLSTKVP